MQFAGIQLGPQGLINPLLALHATLSREFAADDDGFEMLAIAIQAEVLAGEAGENELFDLFRMHHGQYLNFQPRFSNSRVNTETPMKQATTMLRLTAGETSETPKKP